MKFQWTILNKYIMSAYRHVYKVFGDLWRTVYSKTTLLHLKIYKHRFINCLISPKTIPGKYLDECRVNLSTSQMGTSKHIHVLYTMD